MKPSIQYDYDDDYEQASQEEVPTTTMRTEINGATTIYKSTYISAPKGIDLVLNCYPQNEIESVSEKRMKSFMQGLFLEFKLFSILKAKWLNIQPNSDLSIATNTIVATLTIKNVTHDSTYECKQADKIVERFAVTVNGN